MTSSMTGFAGARGQGEGYGWTWDLRSVNGRGLDLRFRLPDWIEGLEPPLREMIGKRIARGNVTVTLRVNREEGAEAARLDEAALKQVLATVARAETLAAEADIAIAPVTASDLLAQRGVLVQGGAESDTAPLRTALVADFARLLEEFAAMRDREGAALGEVIGERLDSVERLVRDAEALADARREKMAETLKASLARVLENAEGADEGRVAQELAMIAVKADVTEELDRLRAHVDAARELLEARAPSGRRLDFLMQEFNREANTLCSKSQFSALTAIGLDLKATIDQMREQVQNVE